MRGMRTLTALFFAVSATAWADDLNPDTVGAVDHEQKQAQEKLDAKYGNRKPGDMSNEERREYMKEQDSSRQEVLSKHGVDDKEYSRYQAHMNKDDLAGAKAADARMTAKEKAAAEKAAADKAAAANKEIPIQKGFSESNPVDPEGKEGAEPTIERGTPGSGAPQDAEKPTHSKSSKHHSKKTSNYE
jgi:hypothetical protein